MWLRLLLGLGEGFAGQAVLEVVQADRVLAVEEDRLPVRAVARARDGLPHLAALLEQVAAPAIGEDVDPAVLLDLAVEQRLGETAGRRGQSNPQSRG